LYIIIMMTGPNILTLGRILAIPILVIALLTNFHGHRLVAFIIFILAVLTDMLDGYWARRKDKKSSLGELLDPTADKLIVTSALICLVELDQVSAWMAIVIIGREIAVTAFRAMASSRGIAMPASVLGKIKMNAEAITIALLILGETFLQQFYLLAEIGLWVVLATALFSAAEYYWRLGPQVLRESKD
jgi:CDP-diacylglycerol--glycerol-3-phosphate 3-phosphatidyltransferase